MILTYLYLISFFCLFDNVLLLPSTDSSNSTSENSVPCEEEWHFFDGQCYKVGGDEEELVWKNASLKCEEWGGKLASIHSKDLNDFLAAIVLGVLKRSAWIGLIDQDERNLKIQRKQANFSWEDGSTLDYENWAEGEPSPFKFHGYEGCGEIMFSTFDKKLGKWNDLSCASKQGYICEKPSNETLNTPDSRFCSVNEEGGWRFYRTCFHVITEPKSWNDAQLYCQEKFNGNLATITDYSVDHFLKYILSADSENQYWIGIKVKKGKNQHLKWNSQWYVSYNHFDQSLEDLQEGMCSLRINETEWTATSCKGKHAFICERTNDTAPVLPTVQGVSCPDDNTDWKDFGGDFCYFFDTNSSVTWYAALRDCIKKGGTLASILSEEQEIIFQNLLHNTVWSLHIGLTSIPSYGKEYVWTDMSSLNYTNWAPNEPNLHSEKCGEFIIINRNWNDINCASKKGYICEVKKSNPNMEIGRSNILSIFENYMLHSTDEALLTMLKNSTNSKESYEFMTEEIEHDPSSQVHPSQRVVVGLCVFVVLLVVSIGILGYYYRHWIKEKTEKLTSVHYKPFDSSKYTDITKSPILLQENE